MNFFSLELSKEMQAVGCRSDADHRYLDNPYSIFHLSDFLSPSPQARDNCEKWWGASLNPDPQCPVCHQAVSVGEINFHMYQWQHNLEVLLDLDTTQESIEDFMKRTRRKL